MFSKEINDEKNKMIELGVQMFLFHKLFIIANKPLHWTTDIQCG